MKRQSIAEQTLAKQIKNIVEQIADLNYEAEKLGVRIFTLTRMQEDMEAEIETLRQARLTASESRK